VIVVPLRSRQLRCITAYRSGCNKCVNWQGPTEWAQICLG